VADQVSEGGAAIFEFTRVGDVSGELTVTVSVSDPGGVLDVNPLPEAVIFPAGDATTRLTLNTDDDEVAGPDAQVTVQLVDGDAYTPDAPSAATTVMVEDNDLAISGTVSPASQSVEEGQPATVTVRLEASGAVT